MLLALSLTFPYLFGLGCLVLIPYYRTFVVLQQAKPDRYRSIATILMAGILLNYLLVSIIGKLEYSILLGGSLSCVGFWLAFRSGKSDLIMPGSPGWPAMLLVLYLLVLYAVYIFFDPITAWDARSIWFFHAKVIYYNQAFSSSANWNMPSMQFSHVGYPKLVPIMAAQFASAAGYWNEYVPKGSLLVLLMPLLFASLSFINKKHLSSLYLIAFLFFSLGMWLWNGYIDGYLALYAAFSTLFIGRWLDDNDPLDLTAGIICLGIIGNLKNEGMFYILTITACIAAILHFRRKNAPLTVAQHIRSAWPLLLFISIGMLLWYGLKLKWGLISDNPIQLSNIPVRLGDGSLIKILDALFMKSQVGYAFALFILAAGTAKIFRTAITPSAWLPILTSLFYFIGMVMVYCATSQDLSWHLATSADRTMLPVLSGTFAATFALLRRIEQDVFPYHRSRSRKSERPKKINRTPGLTLTTLDNTLYFAHEPCYLFQGIY